MRERTELRKWIRQSQTKKSVSVLSRQTRYIPYGRSRNGGRLRLPCRIIHLVQVQTPMSPRYGVAEMKPLPRLIERLGPPEWLKLSAHPLKVAVERAVPMPPNTAQAHTHTPPFTSPCPISRPRHRLSAFWADGTGVCPLSPAIRPHFHERDGTLANLEVAFT